MYFNRISLADWLLAAWHELGQCKARPIKFHPVCLFFILFFLFFLSVLQQITVLALHRPIQRAMVGVISV